MLEGRRRPLTEVSGVVFSRDRALQLDAFLQSVRLYAPGLFGDLAVIYRATAAPFADGYRALVREWPDVTWREETAFGSDVTQSLGDRPFVVFHTDADLYFARVASFYVADEVACFSFRLGLNTTYCYPLDFDEQVTPEREERDWIAWRWREHGRGAFGYPLALNGHVFAFEDVRRWVQQSEFSNPNELEVSLQAFLHELPPLMASFRESRIVNVPANRVNESFANRNAGMHDIRELNERFLRGERIDLGAMDFSAIRGCHQEITLAFGSS